MKRDTAGMACFFLLIILLVLPVIAGAERNSLRSNVTNTPSRTYGTKDYIVHTIHAFSFTGTTSASDSIISDYYLERYCTDSCELASSVDLPAGADIKHIELEAYDENDTGNVKLELLMCPTFQGCTVMASAETGIVPIPQYTFASADLSTNTFDGYDNSYFARVSITGGDDFTTLRAVRIYYMLQMTPVPSEATFLDVPTNHWAFPFVEALAAAGMTAGCNPPANTNFCPNSNVSRGQMAVFLAKALGLHWTYAWPRPQGP